MAGDIVGQPTVFTGISITSTPGSALTYPTGLPSFVFAGGGRAEVQSGSSLVLGSGATLTFLPGMQWSCGTLSTAASLASLAGTGFQLGIFFGASGCSLMARSGNTIYTIGASAVSAAAP